MATTMTKTEQALECLYLKLRHNTEEINNIYIHFPEHYLGLLDCLAVVANRLDWTYCTRTGEDGYIYDLEYKRDDILDLLIIDDFTIEIH